MEPATRFEAVPAQRAATETDPAERRRAERREVDGRLRDAALRTVLNQLPVWGAVVGGCALLTVLALAQRDVRTAAAWGLPALLVALALMLLRRALHPTAATVVAVTTLTVAIFAIAPWLLLGPDTETALWGVASAAVMALTGASTLAPMMRHSTLAAALLLSPALAAAVLRAWPACALALLACAAAWALAAQRRHTWRQNTRALIVIC